MINYLNYFSDSFLSVKRKTVENVQPISIKIYYLKSLGDELMSNDDHKKRPRTAFTASQIKALVNKDNNSHQRKATIFSFIKESEFEKNKYLSVSKRMQLSKQLKLTETQVI